MGNYTLDRWYFLNYVKNSYTISKLFISSNSSKHCTKNEVFHEGISSVNLTKFAENCEFGHIY